jgi:hypothetical protein
MTEFTNGPGVPGSTLLKIARLLLSERLVSAVIEPTISDLQCEVAEAGLSRAKRVRAHWRGYRAFWTLVIVAPFASWTAPTRHAGVVAFPDAVARLAIGSTFLTLIAVISPVVGALVAIVTATAALFAVLIHAWYQRHPSDLPTPNERRWRSPQINFSSTEVAGNSGGLIFVVGSVFVLTFGVPTVFWFVLAGTVAGCGVARGLAAWHTRHPQRGLPENRIVWR